jgi:hypothetical protein
VVSILKTDNVTAENVEAVGIKLAGESQKFMDKFLDEGGIPALLSHVGDSINARYSFFCNIL